MDQKTVDKEVVDLIEAIKHLGSVYNNKEVEEGLPAKSQVEFGVLFNDEGVANKFEALVGTLRSAKKKKIIKFEGEMLFQGVHDKVLIIEL